MIVEQIEKINKPTKKEIQKEEVIKQNNFNEMPEKRAQPQPQNQFSLQKNNA